MDKSAKKLHHANEFGKQAILLLIVQGLHAAATALSSTFVNVYLWKISNNYITIASFALSHQIAGALTFFLAGKWVKEYNKMNSLRLGVVLSGAFYLLILLLQEKAIHYVLLLGALQGIAAGFFWLAFNVVYFEITDRDNRDKFNGWAGLLSSLAGMLAPWISGIIITQMKDEVGYMFIFAVSLGIFFVAAVISFFLTKREVQDHYEWFHGFRQLGEKGNVWRKVMPALTAQGFREGVFAFLIALLVFKATSSELRLGNFSLVTSGVALVSYWVAGKILKPSNRSLLMLLGTIALIAFILPLFIALSYPIILIFGIGTAVFLPYFVVPMTSSVFDIIGKTQESAQHRVEYVVLRETGLNLGRILGTVLFIIVLAIFGQNNALIMTVLILIIGSTPLVAWMFMRNLLDQHERNVKPFKPYEGRSQK
ncbi:MFS transporter [Longirhabdus pacifica]|uniref:MFS transporter n=1 Tax=Longirhabdus pacifica TaxID=2305227 RepID=UPI00100889B7|nr:MFS transporter [Longirhabdus pacifica]